MKKSEMKKNGVDIPGAVTRDGTVWMEELLDQANFLDGSLKSPSRTNVRKYGWPLPSDLRDRVDARAVFLRWLFMTTEWSPAECADKAGIHRATIYQWLAGKPLSTDKWDQLMATIYREHVNRKIKRQQLLMAFQEKLAKAKELEAAIERDMANLHFPANSPEFSESIGSGRLPRGVRKSDTELESELKNALRPIEVPQELALDLFEDQGGCQLEMREVQGPGEDAA